MKNILWILGLLFSVSLAVSSCEETEGVVDPYYKWQERNERYIDSIAEVAKANPGEWRVILSYKITPDLNNLQQKTSDYIYCRLLEKGEGTMKPIYTDSVVTHYRGKLIPLYNGSEVVFDQSFKGELNTETAVPVGFGVGEVIVGWTTALQEMVEGDRWEVYIPQGLGYGQTGSGSSIPAYSTLIFDMKLEKLYTNR